MLPVCYKTLVVKLGSWSGMKFLNRLGKAPLALLFLSDTNKNERSIVHVYTYFLLIVPGSALLIHVYSASS